MKKLLQLVTGLCLLALMPVQFASAAGSATVELSKSKSSVAADGSSSVTITLYAFYEGCPNYDWDAKKCIGELRRSPAKEHEYNIAVSGSNNTFPASVTTNQDGKVSFTLKSTTAEIKTISLGPKLPSITVTFTKPVAKVAPKPAPAPAPAPTPPTSPAATVIKADEQAVADAKNITVQSDKVFTIGGTTVANGVVKLFIFSDPKEATVTADAQGNWTYGISGLEPGGHHVEAEVTDPATSLTSARATLANFTVTAPPVVPVIATTTAQKQNFLPYVIAGAVLIAAGIAAGVWWYIRKRKASAPILAAQQPNSSDDSAHTTDQPNSKL